MNQYIMQLQICNIANTFRYNADSIAKGRGLKRKLKTDEILEARSKAPALKKINLEEHGVNRNKKAERRLQEKLKKIVEGAREHGRSEKFANANVGKEIMTCGMFKVRPALPAFQRNA